MEYEGGDHPSPYHNRPSVSMLNVATGRGETSGETPGVPLDEMVRKNRRIFMQLQQADRVLVRESLYPDENVRVLVVKKF